MVELSYQTRGITSKPARSCSVISRFGRPTASVLWMCYNAERALNNAPAAETCATQLRSGFPGSPELAQLNEEQRGNVR